MSEFPWFKFFSADWIMETQFMTMEERGYYITLLCHQHQNGPIQIDRLRFLGFSYNEIPEVVLSKFEKGQKGTLFNKKMNTVTSGYAEYIEKQKEYGKKGGRPKKQNKKGSQNHVNESDSDSDSSLSDFGSENDNTDTVSLRVQESEPMNNLLSDQQWIEQLRMKNRAIKDWKMFFEYLRNKCAIEEIDHDTKKIMARANLLAMNWKSEKKEADKLISKQDQILNQIIKNEEDRKTGTYTGSDEGK